MINFEILLWISNKMSEDRTIPNCFLFHFTALKQADKCPTCIVEWIPQPLWLSTKETESSSSAVFPSFLLALIVFQCLVLSCWLALFVLKSTELTLCAEHTDQTLAYDQIYFTFTHWNDYGSANQSHVGQSAGCKHGWKESSSWMKV